MEEVDLDASEPLLGRAVRLFEFLGRARKRSRGIDRKDPVSPDRYITDDTGPASAVDDRAPGDVDVVLGHDDPLRVLSPRERYAAR